MPSPRDDPCLLEYWAKLENDYLKEGLSRWSALTKIANEYSLSPKTVYTWLTPGRREKRNALLRSEEYKKKNREWAKEPSNRVKLSKYAKDYYHFRAHLDSYIQGIFMESGRDILSYQAIYDRLLGKCNIRFDKRIVLAAIAKFNLSNEDYPIEEVEPDLFKMS